MKRLLTASAVAASMLAVAGMPAYAQDTPGTRTLQDFTPVTEDMLRNPAPENWLSYRGNYEMWGYSALDQINRDNVKGLTLAWARTMAPGVTQGTPLVYDGIMFLPNNGDLIQAIDAVTGDLIWSYDRPRPEVNWAEGPLRTPRGERKRGVALHDDKLITTTMDNSVVGLDARTGQQLWEVNRGSDGHVASSAGPMVANGVVIVGSTCQSAPFGCYVTGHDIETGEELWRNEAIPRPGQPGADTWGDSAFESRWCTGIWGFFTYDADADLLHYGTTGACPASETQRNTIGAPMGGTNTRYAVRPQTGEVVWSHQVLPRDNWDQECTFEMMLIDTPTHPKADAQAMLAVNPAANSDEPRRTLTGMPCKNPVFWSFDANDGEFIFAKATWDKAQNIYSEITADGTVTVNDDIVLKVPGQEYFMCSTFTGGRDWPSGSYDPTRNVMYQWSRDLCSYQTARNDREATPQDIYFNTSRTVLNPDKGNDNIGRIDAVSPETGETLWTYEQRAGIYASTLSTAGDLLFSASADRYLRAHDADNGNVIWQTRLGSYVTGGTMTYAVDGKQYIATIAGTGLINPGIETPELDGVGGSNMVYVFALPEGTGDQASN